MTAIDVIEQINALPPAERSQVVDFVRHLKDKAPLQEKHIRFADPETVNVAAEKVLTRYEAVFRHLSQ